MKRRLALIVAALALLAGGTAVALGATGSRHSRPRAHAHAHVHAGHSLVASAATYLGVQPSQLRQELRAGRTLAQIADATPGKSQSSLLAALVAARSHSLADRVGQLPGKLAGRLTQPGARHRNRGPGAKTARAAVIVYLGISGKQLRSDRRAGKTLAQIADATPGKSASGLQAVVVAARKARLEAALAAGKISNSTAKARGAHLAQHAHQLLSRQPAAKRTRRASQPQAH
ncbi:MAG TPA: hypothetical protein VGG08_09350 [Solirubrobacteraceae bacterium]|jgi:hypothetical protein